MPSAGPRDEDRDVTAEDALGRLGWFRNPGVADGDWTRHDISRRKRGMFDQFVACDLDGDGDVDFVGTRGTIASSLIGALMFGPRASAAPT